MSIITAWNSQKDRINEIGSNRFAHDTGQSLEHFYSIDKLSNSASPTGKTGCLGNIAIGLQSVLWDASPCTSEHIPGKLSICLGMPVMVRINDATELCITKGQEAVVVGWNDFIRDHGKKVLETLFVKLVNPPRNVELPGLPLNVVPMSRTSSTVKALLPNDHMVTLTRQQVMVLPNFSMTDYAAQGKTRPLNIVELNNCKTTQSYYTCLSRSASADGTIIVQGFDTRKITKGISGFLRQEFRELFLLDEVTTMRYHGTLPEGIFGDLRNPTVRAYQLWKRIKKKEQLPCIAALRWGPTDQEIKDIQKDGTWDLKINAQTAISNYIPDPSKIKPKTNTSSTEKAKKKTNTTTQSEMTITNYSPVGPIWDAISYSCTYDAPFAILYNMWKENKRAHMIKLSSLSVYMKTVVQGFAAYENSTCSLEVTRDITRQLLYKYDNDSYPKGHVFTDIQQLIKEIVGHPSMFTSPVTCPDCNYKTTQMFGNIREFTALEGLELQQTQHRCLSEALQICLNGWRRCPKCFRRSHEVMLRLPDILPYAPHLLVVQLHQEDLIIDTKFKLFCDNRSLTFTLHGVIYAGNYHFNSRIITSDGKIWFHDGQNGARAFPVSHIHSQPSDTWLNTCNDKHASFAIYSLIG
ncbi:uncharacterized protein LACBIDRAFT_304622 [Laccaria bicolor S238N-H82]|uniref:Predicted protein n=1 Tax=Laccaria bicolor (strain S238N-H82 / ATCC MYA-4686) TaxID=486041 RepID=B0DM09_LACBS|nr:uncharacterized protein LACBIDRAFT_304622 [Laccaria bicolor S238N-H82]EDR04391.1 predicted protein [Laccaria bicolor S238N-H82]|eukprot:XP_001884910.1 predicted protein [Laccaria bicolor S238N-H82]